MAYIYIFIILVVLICLVLTILLFKSEVERRESRLALKESINQQKAAEKTQYYHFSSSLPTMLHLTKKLTDVAPPCTYHISLIKLGRITPLFHSIEKCLLPMQDLVRAITKELHPFALAVHDNEYLIMAYISDAEVNHKQAIKKQKFIMQNLPKRVNFLGTPVPIDYAISSLCLSTKSSFFGFEKVQRRLTFDMQQALHRVDGIFYHNEKLYKQEMQNKHIAKEIAESLNRGEDDFNILLQPIYAANNPQTPYAFEALMRWKNKANLGPGTFMPVIAQIPHLHYQITQIILRKAITFFEQQIKHKCQIRRVSINISAEDLASDGFAQMVKCMCDNNPVILCNLTFEVVESEKLAMDPSVNFNMNSLTNAGVSFAIDDFGSGYANFELLKNEYINYLKIDKQYIQSITALNAAQNPLLECMISLCEKTARKVVVEGVETYEQLKYLQSFKQAYVQGFHLCRPIATDEALQMCLPQIVDIAIDNTQLSPA